VIKLIKELLPSKQTPVYVSVSMGLDSVAAYHFLKMKKYNVIPIHFNHNLRKQNYVMEFKFRELFANSRVVIGLAAPKLKTEAECRSARLDFYRDEITNNAIIITGHHLDDYVESYLMNCFRGHPTHTPINLCSDFPTFKIVHPFLLTEKKDFEEFVNSNTFKYLQDYIEHDESNDIIKGSQRNWLRHVIVPEMKKQSVSVKKYCRELIADDVKNKFKI
jgi:tRNA(Ile)-lysidine synthase